MDREGKTNEGNERDNKKYTTDREHTIIEEVRDSDSWASLSDTEEEKQNQKHLQKKSEHASAEMMANLYKHKCLRLGTPPQKVVLDCLGTCELHLPHRQLGSKGIKAVCHALVNSTSIRVLNLRGNAAGEAGGRCVASLLKQNDYITHLDLSENRLGMEAVLALSDMIKTNTGLICLNVSGNDLNEDAAKALASAFQVNRQIEELDLSHNEIHEEGALHFGKAMGENYYIEKLNLSWNHIRKKGAVTLCRGLLDNYSVTQLDISWNGFGYEGALALRDLLQANKYLLELDASYNRIDWHGAMFIADGLRKNKALEKLKLEGNPLTTTGCQDLLEAVSGEESAVCVLDLTGVMVINEFEMLASAIKQTRSFDYKHGGVVNSHDVLGQRHVKRIEPMQRVIEYMRDRELRPTELFRSFDKNVQQKLSVDNFVKRIEGCGIQLAKWEMDELIKQVERATATDTQDITYQKMVTSVNVYREKERQIKAKERERLKRLEEYHNVILNPALPELSELEDESSLAQSMMGSMPMLGTLPTAMMGTMPPPLMPASDTVVPPLRPASHASQANISSSKSASGSLASLNKVIAKSADQPQTKELNRGDSTLSTKSSIVGTTAVVKIANYWVPKDRSTILSMSTNLGAKPKPFGAVKLKKKKKKKKKMGK